MDLDAQDNDPTTTANNGYTWEEQYKRSWDVIQEDAEGSLATAALKLQDQLKRRR
jgi:transcription initiation factor TFIIH subunit 2